MKDMEQTGQQSVETLVAENAQLRARVQELEARLNEREQAHRASLARSAIAEEQAARLTRLYVATLRLNEARAPDQVLQAIQEIINNIIGSEELGIWKLDEASQTLSLVSSMGIEEARLRTVQLGEGVVGRVALTGEPFLASEPPAPGQSAADSVSACVPLSMEDRVHGAIAIFGLLPQKQGLEDVDRELLTLLGEQAAPALQRARLYVAPPSEP